MCLSENFSSRPFLRPACLARRAKTGCVMTTRKPIAKPFVAPLPPGRCHPDPRPPHLPESPQQIPVPPRETGPRSPVARPGVERPLQTLFPVSLSCAESSFSCHPDNSHQPSAIAALEISSSSFVMLAWRILLYSSVRSLMICWALSVAFFMATMRALCSLALASSST